MIINRRTLPDRRAGAAQGTQVVSKAARWSTAGLTSHRIPARPAAARCVLTRLLILTALMAARAAAAADSSSEPGTYQFYLSIFVPTRVSGTTTFPAGPSSPPESEDVRVSHSLVNLNSAFIGGFSTRYGRWGIYTYVIYMDIEGGKSGAGVVEIPGHPVTPDASASARLGFRDGYILLAGTYRLVTDPVWPLDVVFGGRFFRQRHTLDWQFTTDSLIPPASRSGNRSVSQSGGDGILGLKGQLGPTGRGWFAPYYLDVGTGHSNLTWQLNTGVGYGWRRCDAILGWRYMHYDTPRQSIPSIGLGGPVAIFLYRW